jgi:mono/diheme cytochrome c family protein
VRLCTLLLLAGLFAGPAVAQQDQVAAARRIADVASIALAEYAEGVVDGEVVAAEELNEAKLFLADALRTAEELEPEARTAALPYLQRIQTGVEALAPEAGLQVELEGLRRDLAAAVGAPLDPMPSRAPSLARGEALYEQYCASCHGDVGAGDGVVGVSLDPPPADLSDFAALRTVPPVESFRKINVGVAGTAMPGFTEQLDADQRWAVALYAATLRLPPQARAAGAGDLERRCVDCAVFVSGRGAGGSYGWGVRRPRVRVDGCLRACGRCGGGAGGRPPPRSGAHRRTDARGASGGCTCRSQGGPRGGRTARHRRVPGVRGYRERGEGA